MLNYAQVRQESYYAQNYAGIMCQGLFLTTLQDSLAITFLNYSSTGRGRSTNLSLLMLKSLASSLFQNFQASFWSNTSFTYLHQYTRTLTQSLANYSDYLSSQNKMMKTLQAQAVPVRQLSDALLIKYVQPCNGVSLGRFSN